MENEILRIKQKYITLCEQMRAEMNMEGFWTGRLSTSALASAVAVVALRLNEDPGDNHSIQAGFNWLLKNINSDGGFGDTADSVSNVSTTLLCYAAINYCQTGGNGAATLKRMEEWLAGNGITPDPGSITRSILRFYGRDYTFSVPILAMLIVCGVIPPSSVKQIPVLPFELTLLPQSVYRFFNLRVVSYALPALIGVGIFLHLIRRNKFNPFWCLRKFFIKPAIKKLNSLVPESGGFLEAIPLTGFVSMCLIAGKVSENITVTKGLEFIRRQQRDDGGWPVDTDLSTWLTTLSIKAMGGDLKQQLDKEQISRIRKHLLSLQYRETHPFNGAMPGGWGWTSYSGSVPDADDTPGAILAINELYSGTTEEDNAILNGCRWLTGLQNTDGGFPTFCKGWGRLPFDKSCADLTGHGILALVKAGEIINKMIPGELKKSISQSILRAADYLGKHQLSDGAWLPLWFGSQLTDDKTNPAYGTAKVCTYLSDCLRSEELPDAIRKPLSDMYSKAVEYLVANQNDDGSWGGKRGIPGTVEETSLAICALASVKREACLKGIKWLEINDAMKPSPIGLYFALLWYDEKLYPMIYQVEALRRFLEYK
jgi:squalene-hopene/tetraprenyl-beta-curcumene cyclase